MMIFGLQELFYTEPETPTKSVPITVSIRETTKQTDLLAIPPTQKSIPPIAKPHPEAYPLKTPRGSEEAHSAKISGLTYKDLLEPGSLLVDGNYQGSQDEPQYYGPGRTQIITRITNVKAEFDLPLVFRKSISKGKATAKLVKKAEGILIEYMTGTPVFRAALFEALHRPSAYKALRSLFEPFESDQFKIIAEMTSEFDPTAREDYETQIKVFDGKVSIFILKNTERPKRGATGFVLPDEHAKKAILKDKLHLEYLKSLPAFHDKILDHLITPDGTKGKIE